MFRVLIAMIAILGVVNAEKLSATCNKKIDKLNKQIAIAEQFGNSSKIDGLKKSLAEIKAKCKDDTMSKEVKAKISKYENKINETKKDIESAKQSGKALKVKTKEAKLQVLEKELENAKQELLDLAK